MTILEAKSLLFGFFSANHTFAIDGDIKKLVPISITEELDRAIFHAALDDMEKAEIVRLLLVEDHKVWVLNQPLDNYNQTIVLTKVTCGAIVSLLNAFAEQLKSDELLVDPLNVREKDIQNLLILLQNHLKK